MTSTQFDRFKETWKASILERRSTVRDEFPDYPISDPGGTLVSTSRIDSFEIGTGASIYTNSLLPAITQAKHEIILVTCFWAESSTRSALKDALEKLAGERREHILRTREHGTGAHGLAPLKVRICFSSRSLFQKLFHTWSRNGYVYPPSTWASQLGLPSPEVLESGRIDLRVKSIFFLPFSVLHSKYVIVDRQRAWFPSCNVSWEAWLEGCVEISGDAVASLVKFHRHVWDPQLESQLIPRVGLDLGSARPPGLGRITLSQIPSFAGRFLNLPGVLTPTILLPSSHHRNPRFNLIPYRNPSVPSTPLNCAILRLIDMAEHSIYIQTPNITSMPVINSILEALKRGVDVVIVTSKGLMFLEQIVTAGTTTSICLRSLIRSYQKLQTKYTQLRQIRNHHDSEPEVDIEAQQPQPGSLKISYYRPQPGNQPDTVVEEPQKSHIKLTIIDRQYTVLGSGNMDRASWFTSQELGILFYSADFATAVSAAVAEVLVDRSEPVFSSVGDN
ncbi:phospholipase D/nuclease [Hypoxylon cercidicola]|nr:phospholipase D/nuclease [Hypoxylon cercidicola]